MPTNEERREVARKLRTVNLAEGAAQVEENEGLGMAAAGRFVAIPNLGSTIGGMGAVFSFYDLQNRLADLIDPLPERTCRVVPMDAAGNPPYRKGPVVYNAISDGCSECGYPFDTLNRGVPNYCRNCGSRVVVE